MNKSYPRLRKGDKWDKRWSALETVLQTIRKVSKKDNWLTQRIVLLQCSCESKGGM